MFDARPNTAALIAEPVQAVGGLAPPQKWWERLDEIRKKRGILLIADEVQTGLGRTGKMFAVEHYGLQPEIMTGGKGLSGGVGSLAATMASDAVSKAFFGGTTPTSGGNAVSAAAGHVRNRDDRSRAAILRATARAWSRRPLRASACRGRRCRGTRNTPRCRWSLRARGCSAVPA